MGLPFDLAGVNASTLERPLSRTIKRKQKNFFIIFKVSPSASISKAINELRRSQPGFFASSISVCLYHSIPCDADEN